MHVLSPEMGMIGSTPIVAGTISLALGASLASRIRRDGRITVSFFGDGATGEGVLYEALNFAALRCLPLILVCENNLYSTHMSIQECRPQEKIAQIGKSFGISTFRVDGNKVLKVLEIAQKAVDLCREGRGPVFIECLTYRLRGHVGPDDNIQGNHVDIRPPEELTKWKKKDPVDDFARHLLKKGLMTRGELEEIRREVEVEVKSAHILAKASPYPKEDELSRYVFK